MYVLALSAPKDTGIYLFCKVVMGIKWDDINKMFKTVPGFQ